MSALSWQDRAACLSLPLALFFPFPGDTRTREEAFSVCAECPVIAECEAFAEETQTVAGVFGGRDFEQERLRRGHRRQAASEAVA